ncbi:MAG: hypothetical protein E2O52_04710 [Gammaproteobacteria bacterium]|nr:MAG: hypothetical protein E2O52_04710 [Gammaproteobacteria bacterium]
MNNPLFDALYLGQFLLNGGAEQLLNQIKFIVVRGSLVELDADIVYNPWRRFGLGGDVRYFNANVKSKGSSLNGEFDFQYFGPVVYAKFTF